MVEKVLYTIMHFRICEENSKSYLIDILTVCVFQTHVNLIPIQNTVSTIHWYYLLSLHSIYIL